MKKLLLFAMAVMGLTACVDDGTNDSPTPLNEVTISGIQDEYDNIYIDNQLTIRPNLTMSKGDDGQFSYFWIAYDKTSMFGADTVSRERNLDIKVALAPGLHTLKFKALDNGTGVFYEKEFTVNVVNEFSKGLLILCDNGGRAQLDFIPDGKGGVIADVYGKVNGGGAIGTAPKRVYFNSFSKSYLNEVMVLCQDGQGGCFLDGTTLRLKRPYGDFFMSPPEKVMPEAYYKASMRHYLVNDGKLYDRAINTSSPTVKPSMSVAGKTYHIADNANFNDDEQLPPRAVVYDNENMCFYTIYSITTAFLTTATKTSSLACISGGFYNPDQVGMKCLYAGISTRSATGANEYMGVFEDAQGKRWLLKAGIGFWVDDADPDTYFTDLGKDLITTEKINEATTFACSPLFPGFMFYASGSAVYIYNAENKTGTKIHDFGGNMDVNHMEFDYKSSTLLVAYRDKSRTTLPAGFAMLEVGTDGGLHLQLTGRHDGMADRIVDFEHKY
ncbi:MAG: PKD-like family lipoprotein [Prevotella sp.]|nr:PKD-like family lipoprotein [Prevotella sp.]